MLNNLWLINMLIYLLVHSFFNNFGDVAKFGYWLIVLKRVSVKTNFLKQGCDTCSHNWLLQNFHMYDIYGASFNINLNFL